MITYWTNVAMITAEWQRAIWLRFMNLATGGPAVAEDEAEQTASEIVEAVTNAVARPAGVSTLDGIVRSRRKKVRATPRRASKGHASEKRAPRAHVTTAKSRGKR
ncbi:hypothetical protein SAMN05519103_09426 [Rhizobiales bacterium GAS113]|nr:hypothetical protein SAMN05519103_06455 [Rhizobiales bacterium GAS113]SDR64124.1 hypothetical protein SAMN05519103_09426 [Rhizobiales bacterium GAS113]